MNTQATGRRAQNRIERHSQLMHAATELISESGLDGLTMQAVAERVNCAVGTIYTYFASKSSLLAELQIEAIKTLSRSVDRSRALWDESIEAAELDEASAALVRLVATAHLFTAGPTLHPREFELLQVLISSPRRELSEEDTPAVVPHALGMLAAFHALIESAVAVGALSERTELGEHDQQSLRRTLRWLGGVNGALLISNATADPSWLSSEILDGRALAIRLAEDMYLGWGAPPLTLAMANEFVRKLEAEDRLMRRGDPAEVTDITDGADINDGSGDSDEEFPGELTLSAMRLGDITNPDALLNGKPLDGVRILAAEQMQALPYATQLLARLGAEVVKVEHPVAGESGRGALPAMEDPQGRRVGATFLRNNLNKRSVGLDLKSERGRELFLDLAAGFDVVGENFKAGTMDRLGLGYEVLSARYPRLIFVSVSGFGNLGDSPYRSWPAYAMVPEAMSGLYEYARHGDEPPRVIPAGALGDISSALFTVIGIMAALRHRDATGRGQQVDVAMLDSMIAMTDVITNFYSLGVRDNTPESIMTGFRAGDGWFAVQVAREHQFAKLTELVGRPEWLTDERFATRRGWADQLESVVRPVVEEWARDMTRVEVCERLGAAGIPAGPCFTPAEVIEDEHVARRNMLVEMDRTDGVDEPVLIPGNPVKLSEVSEGPESRIPWVGEHTDEVLRAELALSDDELTRLRADGVIT